MNQWCILRTAPSRTLLLAAALTAAGYRAWTPQETRMVRSGHARVPKRVPTPMMPTIVFAEYERLPMLRAIAGMPTPSCLVWDEAMQCHVQRMIPNFHIFRYMDGYPRVADRALDALRVAEQRGRPRDQARVFEIGEGVKYADAGFEGLVGHVVEVRGRNAWVVFGDMPFPVKIPASSLLPLKQAA